MSDDPFAKYNDTETQAASCIEGCKKPLPLALSAYTAEQINAVNNADSSKGARGAPANTTDLLKEQNLPYTDLSVPGQAGGYAAAFGTDTHIPQASMDELKSRLQGSGSGDYRLYYSGNGDRAYIEQRIDKIFGRHLSAETRNALIAKLEKRTTPIWIDATDTLHEAYNNTINWVIEQNPTITKSLQSIIDSNVDSMKYADVGYDGYMQGATGAIGAAINTQDVFMNTQLSSGATGAPEHMQSEASQELFAFGLMAIIGGSGIALRPAVKATRATKSYFKKFKHEFGGAKKPARVDNGVGQGENILTRSKKVSSPGNKPELFRSFTSNENVPLIYRRDSRFESLASDPAHGNKITLGGRREAMAGLEAESLGLVKGKIQRGPAEIEFFDANGVPFDVKTPVSPTQGQKNFFNAEKTSRSILRQVDKQYPNKTTGTPQNVNVILDSTYLDQANHKSLWEHLNKNATQQQLNRIIELNVKL